MQKIVEIHTELRRAYTSALVQKSGAEALYLDLYKQAQHEIATSEAARAYADRWMKDFPDLTKLQKRVQFCKMISDPRSSEPFAASGDIVFQGAQRVAHAKSGTFALRIANALNVYQPGKKGY